MFEKILVPLDGSELASQILALVEELAWAHKSEVVLLSVVKPPRATESTRSEDIMALNQQILKVMENDARAFLAGKKRPVSHQKYPGNH